VALARKRKDLEKAQADWNAWTADWEAALKVLQFPATATADTAEAQINAIDDMREAAVRIHDLRHDRIEKIERDIKAFEADVAFLVQAVAPHLDGTDPESAVLELNQLAGEDARVRDLKDGQRPRHRRRAKKIEECRASSGEAREIIALLQRKAAVNSMGDCGCDSALRTKMRVAHGRIESPHDGAHAGW